MPRTPVVFLTPENLQLFNESIKDYAPALGWACTVSDDIESFAKEAGDCLAMREWASHLENQGEAAVLYKQAAALGDLVAMKYCANWSYDEEVERLAWLERAALLGLKDAHHTIISWTERDDPEFLYALGATLTRHFDRWGDEVVRTSSAVRAISFYSDCTRNRKEALQAWSLCALHSKPQRSSPSLESLCAPSLVK
jgi:hypothetical protein